MAAQKSRKMVSYAKYGYIFILPFFITYAFFMIYPLINTVRLSFFGNGDAAGASINDFVGFQNYQWLLFGGETRAAKAVMKDFWRTMGNTLILWVGNFVFQIVLSLLLAVWFSDTRIKTKGTGFFKVVMYMPNVITAASVAALFYLLFSDSKYGAINSIMLNLGWIKEPIKFVTLKWSSRALVWFMQTWMWFGNTMLLLLSGIFGIDPSIYEAASIDGSSGMNTFFRITMPILKPIFIYVFITSMIGGLQMFDIPYMFHPGSTPRPALETIAVNIYGNFYSTATNYGFAAAASVIMFVITCILGLLVYRFNTDSTAPKKKKKAKVK